MSLRIRWMIAAIAATAVLMFHAPALAAKSSCTPISTLSRAEGLQWLRWINAIRRKQDLPLYVLDDRLTRTATEWSATSAARGSIDHKRPGQTVYYDYRLMTQWFADRGLVFDNMNGTTFTESIGWGVVNCKKGLCDHKAIAATSTTLDFFLAEKNKTSRPHYNAIVNPLYQKIGVGLALNPDKSRYYLTVHYGTGMSKASSAVADSCQGKVKG